MSYDYARERIDAEQVAPTVSTPSAADLLEDGWDAKTHHPHPGPTGDFAVILADRVEAARLERAEARRAAATASRVALLTERPDVTDLPCARVAVIHGEGVRA